MMMIRIMRIIMNKQSRDDTETRKKEKNHEKHQQNYAFWRKCELQFVTL